MKKRIIRLASIFLAITSILTFSSGTVFGKEATTKQQTPVVLVHGLFGWGNNEFLNTYYWGGSSSLKEWLEKQGYTVFTPTIGPVSSNWDRACELYAYLKGGTVDYGLAHSKKYGHERYGRTYPGVYPQLGELSKTGEIQKINLIGHSMGGQTVRTLVELLEDGSEEERKATPADELSPLFEGGKSWVKSVTTIATPHDGSQEAHEKYEFEPMVHQFFAAMAAQTGISSDPEKSPIDFQLDQWGLRRNQGESYASFYKRVMESNLWKKTNDLSLWDLSPEGAKELNSWVKAKSDVYYFSIGCLDTHASALTGFQIPNVNMNAALLKSSIFMGNYTNNTPGDVQIDSSWWPNDGIVSLISAESPKVGSEDRMVEYNGTPEKGVWNYLGTVDNADHLDIVQMKENRTERMKQYLELIKMLENL